MNLIITEFKFRKIEIYYLNGDWGLGIWGLAQSPIPNPQSPIPNPQFIYLNVLKNCIITYFLNKIH
jgi:hypothetical protein